MEDVAVVGWSQTRHERAMVRETHQSMLFAVATEALSSCGLTIHDVDVVISAGSDFLDGRGISTVLTVDAMGAHFKEESKVAGDGMFAALYAYMRLASGLFDSALVVAYGKSSESSIREQTAIMAEPFFLRPLGLDALSAGALQARSYLHHFGVDDAACARVVVKNRGEGAKNPHAQLRTPVTLEEVMESEEILSPIRKLEACPVTDGACAVVLATGGLARSIGVKRAWVAGVGHCQEAYYPGVRELHRARAAAHACEAAYAMAGIENPLKELGVAELAEYYAYQELMLYEAMGLCEEGDAGAIIDSGATGRGGTVVVNPSGGALCANPVVATGLVRLAEAASQVSERAGDLQVPGVKKALALGNGGLAMQSAAVFVLEK